MKRLSPFAVLLLLAAHACAAGSAPLWFVPASVADGKFVSFLPPRYDKDARMILVWAETNRLAAWRQCVAETVGIPVERVVPLEEGESFRIRVPSETLRALLEDGGKGVSIVGPRTNALVVADTADPDVPKVRPGDSSHGRLFPDRGAGNNLWFVTDDELAERWKSHLRFPDERPRIRGEIQELVQFWKGHADPEAPARVAWLRGWRKDHSEVWPCIRFVNSTGNPITVDFGTKPRKTLSVGEPWTVEPDSSWTNGIPFWTYHEDGLGSSLHEADFEPVPNIKWSIDGSEDVEIKLGGRKWRSGMPTFDLRSVLPKTFDPNRAGLRGGDFEVTVMYSDRKMLSEPDESGSWKRKIDPRRTIESVRIATNAFFEGAVLTTDLEEYPHGATNVVVGRGDRGDLKSPTLEFRPWPSLVLTNALDRTLTNEVSVSGTDVRDSPSVSPLGEGEVFPLDDLLARTFAPNATSLVVKIRTVAERSQPGVTNLTIVRGGADMLLSVRPERLDHLTGVLWPEKDELVKVGSKVGSIDSSQRVRNSIGGKAMTVDDVVKSSAITNAIAHLKSCAGINCDACREFRIRLKENGCPFVEGRLTGLSQTDAALACYRIFLIGKKGKRGQDLEAAVDKARDTLGASPRALPKPRKENEP